MIENDGLKQARLILGWFIFLTRLSLKENNKPLLWQVVVRCAVDLP